VKGGRAVTPRAKSPEEECMSWTTPKIVEISVGMEINSYACADL
jgi:coenzyme PQQ precursor peptide PqqA